MSDAKKYTTYNGVRVVDYWPQRIEQAQLETIIEIDGREFRRIPYGSEAQDWGADRNPCHDCAVIKGQYHVLGCDVERCPACGGQLFSCDCRDKARG